MAAFTLEDQIGESMETISPTDLEVLDIFNFSNSSASQTPIKDVAPPCSFVQRSLDQQLINATMTVLKTGKLTPLIKEELKCTIQNRRLARGEEEMTVDMSPPTPTAVSPEEEAVLDEKRRVRRERNRIAALKCRRKKSAQLASVTQQCQQLETQNAELRSKLEEMNNEKTTLLLALRQMGIVAFESNVTELIDRASGSRDEVGVTQTITPDVNKQVGVASGMFSP